MDTCSMCGKKSNDTGYRLAIDKPVCSRCAQAVKDLLESNNTTKTHGAYRYIRACAEQATDMEMAKYLTDMLESNAPDTETMVDKEGHIDPVESSEKPETFVDNQNSIEYERVEANNPPISTILAALAWITWVVGILGAILIAYAMPSNGLAWFIGIGAGVLVAGCMPMALSTVIQILAQISHEVTMIRKKIWHDI